MEDVQQAPRERIIKIQITDREWNQIKIAEIYQTTPVESLVKTLLLRWASKNQTPPPDKEDSELTRLPQL